jgi:Carboxypeptidase regulatory-like domain
MVAATTMRTLVLLGCLAGVPGAAFGQAAIGGVVADPSGAPVAGVIVEASSAALIEKTRTTATDRAGRYRIEDLRPGTYLVRFTLQGWKPYYQEGIELAGSFTAIVNAQLAVGSMTETITVTGQTPVIDVYDAMREVTLRGDVVRLIPTARSYNALLVLIPGVLTTFNDTATGTATTMFPIHGGRANEGRLSLDGLTVGSPPSGNSATSYVIDVGQSQEVTFAIAGGLGESETAGLTMNIAPKSGGNAVHGSFFGSGTAAKFQSDNLTPELAAQGVPASTPLKKVYDVSGTVGGPIVKDRLWYFVNGHTGGSTRDSANVYYNLNAGDPNRWLYAPDVSRKEYSDRTFENASGRLTWQVTPRNKVSGFWDVQSLCRACTGATSGGQEPARVSPEAVGVLGRRLDVTQATWSSPITNRLFVEAGYGGIFFGVGNFEREPNPTRDLIRVAEQCASGCTANGSLPGLVYRSQDFSVAHTGSYLWKGSIGYVTGTHSLKIGYQHTFMTDDRQWFTNNQNLTYRVDNGEPNQLTQSISPWVNNARAGWDALFVQEQWTRGRLTLQGALRFDRARSWFPAQQEGPSRFLPAPIVIPETRGVDSFEDLTPRMGVAYDVFGTGRTAIKMALGRYLEGTGVTGHYANTNPSLRMPQTTSAFGTAGVTRAWTDTNRNFVPDCDLLNPAAQDMRASGGDVCGVMSNTNFGKHVLSNNFDPSLLKGWGVRPSDWNLGVTMQQQIGSRSAIDVTYSRRWYRGFSVVDNLALQPSDLTPFSLVAPLDARLPGGGGYVVSGLYDVVPERVGQVDNFVVESTAYGKWYQYFNGLDVSINARIARSLTVMAGTSTGQTVADNCAVRAQLPEFSTTTTGTSVFGGGLNPSAVTTVSPYCHVAYGILTQLRGLASYAIPKIDVQLAATFQSKPGALLAANYAAPNSVVARSLGKDLSGNAANVTVNLLAPGTMYGNRINQFDLRVAKSLKYGRSRTLISLDLYNVLNSSAVLTYNNIFVPGGPWLQPLTILTPRFFKITAEIEL